MKSPLPDPSADAEAIKRFERATAGNRTRTRDRDQLFEEVIDRIDELETKLIEALGGTLLLGAPNLGPSFHPVYGYNVRSLDKRRRLPFLREPNEASKTLILSHNGEFSIVEMHVKGEAAHFDRPPHPEQLRITIREAEADDFRVEDLVPILHTVAVAGDANLFQLEQSKSMAATRRLRALCDALRNSFMSLQ